jgi:hypothetical protein
MSYLTQDEIAGNGSMAARVAQAAAGENVPYDPDRWAYEHRRTWSSAPGWDAAWESFRASHPDPEPPWPDGYVPADPGADPGVITDGQILSQVQSMLAPSPEADPA